ncbi:hypothetical protein EYF80_054139 [Liparis tanakae]|uniref:Uncharacterized protein n=1 Tax=Liparis tanakae TaxID=230148 RepID=A0A4Z2F4L4_9TELE|nr:hypothetical protein EYF80_054139 [Liparis tanakae]
MAEGATGMPVKMGRGAALRSSESSTAPRTSRDTSPRMSSSTDTCSSLGGRAAVRMTDGGRAHAAVQLQVALQDVAEFGGGVSLDQPGPGQQARQEGLQVLQEVIHRQATRPPHRPVQSRQRVGRSPGEPRRRAGRLLLLQTLGGLPERNTRGAWV